MNKNNKYNILIYLDLVAAILFPVIAVFQVEEYSANIVNGLFLILILAIMTGLLLPNIMVSWLIILLTTIAAGFLVLGYVVIPTEAKWFLVVAFPIEAGLLTVLRYYVLDWRFISKNRQDIRNYLKRYNGTLKMHTCYTANKIYSKVISNIKERPQLHLWMHVSMLRWANHEQFAQLHLEEHGQYLEKLADILKKRRLAAEELFYLGDATFFIISPELRDDIIKQINQETIAELKKVQDDLPGGLKWTSQRIDETNVDRFTDPNVIVKHLDRELETDLIVEYLKAEAND